jgi:AraC-like DNA-binding protein
LARLDAAMRRLRAGPPKGVTEGASGRGLQSSQYFANHFRRRFGRMPSEHRKPAATNQRAK